MLLSVSAQQLLVLELDVCLFEFALLSVLGVAQLAILYYDLLVLPGSPKFVLNLLLLLARLLQAEHYLLLSLLYLYHVLVFA